MKGEANCLPLFLFTAHGRAHSPGGDTHFLLITDAFNRAEEIIAIMTIACHYGNLFETCKYNWLIYRLF